MDPYAIRTARPASSGWHGHRSRLPAIKIGWASMVMAGIMVWSIAVPVRGTDPPNVLDLPGILLQQTIDQARGIQMLRSGQYGSAKLLFRQNVLRVPHDMASVYNLACAYALLGDKDEALDMLRAAVKLGFRQRQQMASDEDLAALRSLPEFQEILKSCDDPPLPEPLGWKYQVTIAPSLNAAIKVDSPNMLWNGKVMQVFVAASGSGQDRLAIGATGAWGDKIMEWEAAGTASGNVGDLYDNHDRLHSNLNLAKFPQLSPIRFGPEVQKRQFDNGPQRLFLFFDARPKKPDSPQGRAEKSDSGNNNTEASSAAVPPAASNTPDLRPRDPSEITAQRCIVIGNSSTAVTGSPFWRSMPRLILTSTNGAEIVTQHFTHNHLYVYPEHQDYDPGRADGVGWGDTYFANTPYFLISQGSSGSDQPLLESLAATSAAMQPETKEKLKAAGFIAPTLQMIFRRCQKTVQSDDDYLTSAAHPTVFDGNNIDLPRMIEMAHEMKPDDVPPVVMLQVLKEKLGIPGLDYFDEQPSEVLLNTPFAIARMINSKNYWHEMVIAAAGSDLNHRPLEYHWIVLRGDPEKIKVEKVLSNAEARRFRIAYHERAPITPGSKMESSRVDIAVIAHNGVHYSAPAFVSLNFPGNEKRVYDDQLRIKTVDYEAEPKLYVDPTTTVARAWRDEYQYDEQGNMSGWIRIRGQQRQTFNADGELVETPATGDQPAKTRPVKYNRKTFPDGRPFIEQE